MRYGQLRISPHPNRNEDYGAEDSHRGSMHGWSAPVIQDGRIVGCIFLSPFSRENKNPSVRIGSTHSIRKSRASPQGESSIASSYVVKVHITLIEQKAMESTK